MVRANARFAKLAQSLNPDGAAAKSIFRAVNARDRSLLIAAINQAAEGQGDIAPVEAMLDGARERWGQFFVTAVEGDERETEAAIVYMLETTERRALEIALALASGPRILFLDEPTSGLGAEGTARLAELVAELKRTLTLVVIEHDMHFLFGLADTIAVIHWGQVIAGGTPRELRDNPWVARSALAEAAC